jgi:hypothetical protein
VIEPENGYESGLAVACAPLNVRSALVRAQPVAPLFDPNSVNDTGSV